MKLCRSKRLLSFVLITICPLINTAQSFQWVRSLGGSDYDQAKDIQVDGSGNVWSTGYVIGPSTSVASSVCVRPERMSASLGELTSRRFFSV